MWVRRGRALGDSPSIELVLANLEAEPGEIELQIPKLRQGSYFPGLNQLGEVEAAELAAEAQHATRRRRR